MSRGVVLVAAFVAACHSNNARSDAAGDTPVDEMNPIDAAPACTLPVLTTHVATLSGCSQAGTADGPRGVALFSNPVNVALGGSGEAYVADFDSSRIRKVQPDGTVTTIIQQASFTHPFGMAFTPEGNLYVETDDDDNGLHTIASGTVWRIHPANATATVVARDLGRPRGLAVLPNGTIAMADYMHHVVEILDPATGAVTVLAGMMDTAGYMDGVGSAAKFAQPWDVAVLGNGDLAVSDFDNQVIRRVTPGGVVSLYAGTVGTMGMADGTLLTATFDQPKGLAVDRAGNLYVTENGNHDVRRVSAAGAVGRIAGSGTAGWVDSDTATAAELYGVEGLDVSADGTRIVVADGNVGDGTMFNHVRVVVP